MDTAVAYAASPCASCPPRNTRVVSDPRGAAPTAAADVAQAGRTPATLTSPAADEPEAADSRPPTDVAEAAEADKDRLTGAASADPDPSASVPTRQSPVPAAISTDSERLDENVECAGRAERGESGKCGENRRRGMQQGLPCIQGQVPDSK
ncbi:hypothetical protein [Actinospica durhamensis]|uniref:hypothetical protein n=1 Tax=Actinospica durhamensis TaxID=1508375 RepID=UPI0027DC0DCB|nr:hypothetical protein [Actinospica durhamensis]